MRTVRNLSFFAFLVVVAMSPRVSAQQTDCQDYVEEVGCNWVFFDYGSDQLCDELNPGCASEMCGYYFVAPAWEEYCGNGQGLANCDLPCGR